MPNDLGDKRLGGTQQLNVMMSCHQSRLHSGFDRLPSPSFKRRVRKRSREYEDQGHFMFFDHRCAVHIGIFQMQKVRNCRDARRNLDGSMRGTWKPCIAARSSEPWSSTVHAGGVQGSVTLLWLRAAASARTGSKYACAMASWAVKRSFKIGQYGQLIQMLEQLTAWS